MTHDLTDDEAEVMARAHHPEMWALSDQHPENNALWRSRSVAAIRRAWAARPDRFREPNDDHT